MKKRNIVVGTIVLLVGIFALGGMILAEVEPRGHGGMGFCRPMFGRHMHGKMGRGCGLRALEGELNLTDEQHAQLEEIRERLHGSDMHTEMSGVVASAQTLHKAVILGTADEGEIRQAATELGAAIGETAILASGYVEEARGVLTAEQIKLVEEFMAEREAAVDSWLDTVGN